MNPLGVAPASERGAAAIIVAISLLLLMGFAAIAVDMGDAFNQRRQDQSAADFASLAAVQFAKPIASTSCGSFSGIELAGCRGATEAIAVANASLDDPSLADWSDPTACGSPPTGFAVSPLTNCVAFNSNLQKAWVRIPTIDVSTSFGRVLGAQSIATSADAIARTSDANRGSVLPFLTPGSVASGDYDCLKSGPNPGWADCSDLPSTGNFGNGDFFLYGNADMGTTERCSGDTQGRLVSNIAKGVDHPLGRHPTGAGGGIVEAANCPIFSAEPDMAQSQPGVGSTLDDGLARGGSSNSSTGPYPGRIQDSSGLLVRNAQGTNPASRVDNVPLWSHLLGGLGGPCASVSNPSQMLACVDSAKATGTVIFEDSIVDAQRFGFTPLTWEQQFSNPSTTYHFKDYLPVYLDTTFYGCNANSCDILHTPGVADSGNCPNDPTMITCGTPGGGNRTLEAVTAYILAKSILPPVAQVPYPGADNQRIYNLER